MRGLVGKIIARIEQRGLKIIAMKMLEASYDHFDGFYPKDKEWITRLGNKGLNVFKEYGLDPVKEIGSDDPFVIGNQTREALINFMSSGPVVPMVVEGIHAIAVVRKLVGATLPVMADPGTIRGDFSHDAPTAANVESRTIMNMIHASENKTEAAHEIDHWFAGAELLDYDRSDHVIMFGDKRHQ